MKVVREIRFVSDSGSSHSTREAAAESDFQHACSQFLDQFVHERYQSPRIKFGSFSDPAQVDAKLDECFELLRTIRGANTRRKVPPAAKPR